MFSLLFKKIYIYSNYYIYLKLTFYPKKPLKSVREREIENRTMEMARTFPCYLEMFCFLLSMTGTTINAESVKKCLNKNIDDHSHTRTFAELRCNSDYFVDKTLLIKEITEHPERIIWIIRARKMGKTLNLNMLKTFLQMEVDNYGNRIQQCERKNIPLFLGGFSPHCGRNLTSTKISLHQDVIKKHMAKYPIVHLNFESFVNSIEDADKACKNIDIELWTNGLIKKIYNEDYKYLENCFGNHTIVTLQDEKLLRKIYSEEVLQQDELQGSLQVLVRILFNLYKRKSYLLLDEYDTPFVQLLQRQTNSSNQDSQKLGSLLTSMLANVMKSEEYLRGAVITGLLPFITAEGEHIMPSRRVYSILDEQFSPYYGFFEDEIQYLIEQIPNLKPEAMESIRLRYGGYVTPTLKPIYNPFSIVKYLQNNGTSGNEHWNNSADIRLFKNYLSLNFICAVQNAVYDNNNTGIYTTLTEKINHESLNTTSGLLTHLVHAGYLNAIRKNDSVYNVLVPNVEIRAFLASTLVTWQSTFLNIDPQFILEHRKKDLLNDLLLWQQDKFVEKLRTILNNATFDRESATRRFYLGLLLALLRTDGNLTVEVHESEHKKVSPGLVFIPHNGFDIVSAVILEPKVRHILSKPDTGQGAKTIKFTAYDQQLERNHPHIYRIMKAVLVFQSSNITCYSKVIITRIE